MVFTGGTLDASSIRRETRTRGLTELDANAQKALADTTKLVAKAVPQLQPRQQPSAQ